MRSRAASPAAVATVSPYLGFFVQEGSGRPLLAFLLGRHRGELRARVAEEERVHDGGRWVERATLALGIRSDRIQLQCHALVRCLNDRRVVGPGLRALAGQARNVRLLRPRVHLRKAILRCPNKPGMMSEGMTPREHGSAGGE